MAIKNADRWVDLNQISIPPRRNGGFESAVLHREIWETAEQPAAQEPAAAQEPDAMPVMQEPAEMPAAQEITETAVTPESPEASEASPGSGAYLLRMKTQERISLGEDSITIGSGSGADYVISDNDNIGRVHAQISPINGMYYITDMGTNAGTFIDEVPLTSTKKLEGNIVIRLADEDFIFKSHE